MIWEGVVYKDKNITEQKKIINQLKLAGKTVTVNGNKVDNKVHCYNGKFELRGLKGLSVRLEDINEISYGRKILYQRS